MHAEQQIAIALLINTVLHSKPSEYLKHSDGYFLYCHKLAIFQLTKFA